MSKRVKSKRFKLLLHCRAWDRLFAPTFILGATFTIIWRQASVGFIHLIQPPRDSWLFVGSAVAFSFCIFAFLARKINFLQVDASFFKIVTPFLHLKVSYRRVLRIYPVSVNQHIQPKSLSWAEKKFFSPYFGKTAIAVELSNFPIPPLILRLFLPKSTFLTSNKGFVFVVKEWMDLSTTIDSIYGKWQEKNV